MWGLIFWSVVRYRKRSDELPKQTAYNLPLEIVYTVLPFLIIAVLFFYTVDRPRPTCRRSSPNPDVTVQVRASSGTGSSATGAEGPRPAGQHGRHERLHPGAGGADEPDDPVPGASADVIHSFWVPELLFKRDVFPGNVNGRNNVFQATILKEGAYVGRCAELCGTYHSMMNFELRAVSPEKVRRRTSPARSRG